MRSAGAKIVTGVDIALFAQFVQEVEVTVHYPITTLKGTVNGVTKG